MNTRTATASLILIALACATGCDKKNDTTPAKTDTTPRRTDSTTPRSTRSDTTTTTPTTPPAADNTANNKGDGNEAVKTPMDQSQSSTDVKITAEIRRAIMDDKAMSTNAQNCKIITDKSGMVTLRGVVNSQAEKDSIDAKARAVIGVSGVDNQLEVKTN